MYFIEGVNSELAMTPRSEVCSMSGISNKAPVSSGITIGETDPIPKYKC